jgi:hypothetical protein
MAAGELLMGKNGADLNLCATEGLAQTNRKTTAKHNWPS